MIVFMGRDGGIVRGFWQIIPPLILRPTYLETAPFNKLQMLPADTKPITRWSNRDEAVHNVVKEISLVLKNLLASLKTKKDWLAR